MFQTGVGISNSRSSSCRIIEVHKGLGANGGSVEWEELIFLRIATSMHRVKHAQRSVKLSFASFSFVATKNKEVAVGQPRRF